jgi:hypothetical protein
MTAAPALNHIDPLIERIPCTGHPPPCLYRHQATLTL